MQVVFKLLGNGQLWSILPDACLIANSSISQSAPDASVDEVAHSCIEMEAVTQELSKVGSQSRVASPPNTDYRSIRKHGWHLADRLTLGDPLGRDTREVAAKPFL